MSKVNGNKKTVAPPGSEGWKDILQLLKERSEKIEILGRALEVIQDRMFKNNPAPVQPNVEEDAEEFGSLLNSVRRT